MKNRIFVTLFALSLIVMLVGCGNKSDKNNMNSIREYASENMLNNDLNNNANSTNTKISREQAKKIALDEAGVIESDIHDFEIELDKDFGVLVYEIEFNVGGTEYQYEVNADSGKISKREMDLD